MNWKRLLLAMILTLVIGIIVALEVPIIGTADYGIVATALIISHMIFPDRNQRLLSYMCRCKRICTCEMKRIIREEYEAWAAERRKESIVTKDEREPDYWKFKVSNTVPNHGFTGQLAGDKDSACPMYTASSPLKPVMNWWKDFPELIQNMS